jgi:hypothetical protein
MIISFLRTTFTNPGNIPDDDIWKMNIPESFPPEMQNEVIALMVENREKLLDKNRNMILKHIQYSDSTCSTSIIILN